MLCHGKSLMHGSCDGHRYMLLRIVLGLVIVFVVFWAGIRLGQFSVLIGDGYYSGYGSHMMRGWGGYGGYLRMMWSGDGSSDLNY